MKSWNDYFYGPVAAIRPYLFQKLFLLMVATDALVLMTERGSRYGIDGFNVSHFAWLDAIHPLPTATWYVGVLMLVSVLAYTIVFLGPSRVLLALLALLYTYSWAMSRHDSYLHHYMISLILGCMACFPRITYEDLNKGVGILFWRPPPKKNPDPVLTSAWGYRLLGATVGVIYIFTAMAKADAEWCGGHTLLSISDAPDVLSPFVQLAAKVGISSDWFWSIAATLVIPLELTIAASYFLAVRQDEPGRKWLPRWCLVAWVLAMGLHVNNELIDLSIQWFSYYMMFLATFFFLPRRVLLAVGAFVVLPAHWWHERVMTPLLNGSPVRRLSMGTAVTVAAAVDLWSTGRFIGLPGAIWALPVAGMIGILYAAMRHLAAPTWMSREPAAVGAALGLAGVVMAGVVSQSNMRFDYYSNLGKEYQQYLTALLPNAHARALDAYEIAEQYGAPDEQRELELMINMGLAHSRMDEFPAAHEYYRRALEIDPQSHHAIFNQGVAYQVEGKWDQAAACFERVTELQSNFAIAYRELGRVQEQQRKLEAALLNLRTAVRNLPDDATIEADIARVRQARDAAKE